MKRLLPTLIFMLTAGLAFTQSDKVYGDGPGIFINQLTEVSEINSEVSLSSGYSGAITLGDHFFGLYKVNTMGFCVKDAGAYAYSGKLEHMGVWLGRMYAADASLSIYTGVKAGIGYASISMPETRYKDARTGDRFAVLTPELGLEYALHENIRFTVYTGFRWTDGLDAMNAINDQSLRSLVMGINLKVGLPGF